VCCEGRSVPNTAGVDDLVRKAPIVAPEFMRELNKALVLNLVRQERTISRTDIAQRTRLSRSTISTIVNELINEGWLVESGTGKSRGGRRPILLTFNYQAGYVLGIGAGATHLLALVTDLDAQIMAETERPFDTADGPEVGLAAMVSIGRDMLTEAGVDASRLLGIGVGVPGPVDHSRGATISPPIMPGWSGVPVRDLLRQQLFGVPVYLENDANLGALGEQHYGAGQDIDNLAYLKVATGVGCGIIIGGQIYHGQTGAAGEIGHLTIDEDGPPCKCGSFGCLEAMAGGPAIARRALTAVQAGRPTALAQSDLNDGLTAGDVSRAAGEGDALSRQLLWDAGRLLGIAVADLINLLNPGRVIIGGGVSQAGELILKSLRETAQQRSMRAAIGNTDIVQAALGRRSTALGAVALVLEEAFRSPAEDLVR
jgi:glucokinase-like ROK family protein